MVRNIFSEQDVKLIESKRLWKYMHTRLFLLTR